MYIVHAEEMKHTYIPEQRSMLYSYTTYSVRSETTSFTFGNQKKRGGGETRDAIAIQIESWLVKFIICSPSKLRLYHLLIAQPSPSLTYSEV